MKVGKDINDSIRQGEEVPDVFFSFYGIIRDILTEAETDRGVSRVLALAEDLLSESQPRPAQSELQPPNKESDKELKQLCSLSPSHILKSVPTTDSLNAPFPSSLSQQWRH